MFSEEFIRHSQLLYNSFAEVTGSSLLNIACEGEALASGLYDAPFVLLSHNTQSDPIFNYANRMAQQLWKMNWEQFTHMPSRLSAEPVAMAERQAMLEEARKKGFLSNYQGVRISSTGQRFVIKDAILWNVYNHGKYCGQAATFRKWEFL